MSRRPSAEPPPAGPPAAGPMRRDILAAGAAAIAGGIVPPLSAAELGQTEALKKLAAAKGLIYGTTISARQITEDRGFVALVEEQAGLVVPENDMKWQDINRGAPGSDDYQGADTIAGFAVESGMALRGHNILWYYRTPHWFFALPDRDAKERAVIARIKALAGRYRGLIHSWDVVNEPINPEDGRPDGLRKAVFLDALGPGYLDLAYRLTHETDPAARLVVNEYDIELDTPAQEIRRNTLLALLRRMKQAGTPVDAVGVQAHLTAVGGPPFSAPRFRRFLAEIAALGLSIEITELDVTDAHAPADPAVRDRVVADAYRRFLDAALDEPAVKMVVTWGLSDRHSWITRHEENAAKWRKDALPSRPLPFDAELKPKPAFTAIADAFRHAPARSPG
jgi:endo-1,4-beta-xylanase